MKQVLITLCLSIVIKVGQAQNLYFPPIGEDSWDSQSVEALGWCESAIPDLLNTLENNETNAFIILKDGKIVIEEYFDGFHQDSSWIWASAAKSLTSFLVGKAQEQGALSIEESSQKYLGAGWSELTNVQEQDIKIRHHLTLTTGIDYTDDTFCIEPSCFQYLNPPGTHWYYHNGTYVKVRDILESATQQNLNIYTFQNMHQTIGMDGIWVSVNSLNLYFSTARSMARFGLLMLNNGDWDGQVIMEDKSYYESMINSSQDSNPAYGYLWWLNGKSSFKLPSSDNVFSGTLSQYYPDDAYFALGAESQILVVIPSQNIVIVRMGTENEDALVPLRILDDIGRHFQDINCNSTSLADVSKATDLQVSPNPMSNSGFKITGGEVVNFCKILDINGRLIIELEVAINQIVHPDLKEGQYFFQLYQNQKLIKTEKVLVLPQ